MARRTHITTASIVLTLSAATFARTPPLASPAQDDAADAVAVADKISPELIGALSHALGTTTGQSVGAAAVLFGVAKSKLTPDDFARVSDAVPGMDLLLKTAPSPIGPVGTTGTLPRIGASTGGLAGAASAFSQLGIDPDSVGKAIPVLTLFVTQSGGADTGNILAGALK